MFERLLIDCGRISDTYSLNDRCLLLSTSGCSVRVVKSDSSKECEVISESRGGEREQDAAQ